jgi:DNA-binding transcriptional regulator YiaG
MSFATEIKKARDRAGLTQEEFARAVGITRGALANYEVGLREPPDTDALSLSTLRERMARLAAKAANAGQYSAKR